ncbi:yippee-like [Olea europaea subsp. europaea]|uniref:Protein yippee-like n=1 Tax=Olea europaea subsp. europaea TaxID=158383 RepID=A0A8S0P9A8_OLEEU|nr:yippee-like [Olea europaea subsp. europaea]
MGKKERNLSFGFYHIHLYITFCFYYRANVTVGETEERKMMTGIHIVADIFCVQCGSNVGWKYETAHEKSQKYKEGKSVLERSVNCWIAACYDQFRSFEIPFFVEQV